jgi:predicted ATPase
VALSAFIGRDDELARLRNLVRERRIVTLIGPGGVGKTRLALELGERFSEEWPGGVRRIELAAVTPEHDLALEAAAQLGCASLDVAALLLGEQPMLLVLDNCEHLLEQAARVGAQLADTCPRLHLLATSRAPLVVDGEEVFVLGPLGLPATDESQDIAEAAAIRLFSDRVRASGLAWDSSAEHLRHVGELCRRLDGIPLAIELAAARARTLSSAEMLEHLERRSDLLRARGPVGTARHASLRAAIDTSYELLDPEEQVCFRSLGIFAGSFGAPLAHAVCAPPGSDPLDTLDRLARLVDHSLVVAEQSPGGTRFRLLDSLRRYARERAADHGESEALCERFVDAAIGLADDITRRGLERWSGDVLGAVLAEFANLNAAVDLSLARDPSPARAFRLLLPLWGAVHQGRAADVAAACERALARSPGGAETFHAEVLAIAANAFLAAGAPERAAELAERCLEGETVSAIASIVARRTLGMTALRAGRLEDALEHFQRGRDAAGAAGVEPFRRELAVFVAWVRMRAHGDDAALAALDAVADDAAAARDQIAEAWARMARVQLLVLLERHAEARIALRSFQDLERHLEHPWGEEWSLRLDALLATLETSWPATRERWWRAIEQATARADAGELVLTLETAAVLAHRAGDVAAARALGEAAPRDARGSIVGSPYEREFLDLVRSGAVGAPTTGRRWSREALRRVRRALTAAPSATDPDDRDPPDRAGADARPAAAPPAGRLRRAGDVWAVSFAGREVQVQSMKGLEDLARLLGEPDVDVHSLDLMGGRDVGDAGPVLDERSRRDYRARVTELQAEIEEARQAHDLHRAERAEAELDALVEQLSQAFGVGGRSRRTGAAVDRARAAVTWRIRAAIKRLAAVHPELARHLPNAVRTGTWCSYRPETAVAWEIDAGSRRIDAGG